MDRRTLLLCWLASLLSFTANLAGAQTAAPPPRVVMLIGLDEEGGRPFRVIP